MSLLEQLVPLGSGAHDIQHVFEVEVEECVNHREIRCTNKVIRIHTYMHFMSCSNVQSINSNTMRSRGCPVGPI